LPRARLAAQPRPPALLVQHLEPLRQELRLRGGPTRGMLTARGGISVHDATNQVFVRDTASVIEAIREVIRNVDIPPKQVMIEARIVEASTGFANSLGMRLRLADSSALGNRGYEFVRNQWNSNGIRHHDQFLQRGYLRRAGGADSDAIDQHFPT
jgi:type II secretory pathway component HofQ